mmetsp:Transcript_30000/g.36564  ORF Transcript_30000/g.36564 Transcript_30000/m.36564 type:complete len:200 (+) Transcript_30000:291-890(+)
MVVPGGTGVLVSGESWTYRPAVGDVAIFNNDSTEEQDDDKSFFRPRSLSNADNSSPNAVRTKPPGAYKPFFHRANSITAHFFRDTIIILFVPNTLCGGQSVSYTFRRNSVNIRPPSSSLPKTKGSGRRRRRGSHPRTSSNFSNGLFVGIVAGSKEDRMGEDRRSKSASLSLSVSSSSFCEVGKNLGVVLVERISEAYFR